MLVNGLDLHVRVSGEGRDVLLLHGWPDTSRLWRHQVEALNEAGYRTITPDMRGFGKSEKPSDQAEYAIRMLRSDVLGILDQLEVESTLLVGHDWGGALAWNLVLNAPDRIERAAVISAPHPDVPMTTEQREKFWYQYLFCFEDVAESLLQHDEWALFEELLGGEGDFPHYTTDLAVPGALTSSLNVYRANASHLMPPSERPPRLAKVPTLVIRPTEDRFLTESRMRDSVGLVDAEARFEAVEGSGHWAPLEAPDAVSSLLLNWFD